MQNNSPKVSVSAVPFNPQTQSFTPALQTPTVPNVSAVSATPKTEPVGLGISNGVLQSQPLPSTPKTLPAMPIGTTPQYSNPNPTIAVDSLNTQKTNIPTQQPSGVIPQITNQADALLQQTAIQDTQNQKDAQSISRSMLDLIPNLQGEQQAKLTAVANATTNLRQQAQEISGQILKKNAELNQSDIQLAQANQNIEDKPIAMEFITGQQQSVTRNAQIARALKVSEIGVLNAQVLALNGSIELAKQTAEDAVSAKYAPYKEAIDLYKMQLEALQPQLNADEKKQAREQEIKTTLALNDIKDRKEQETKVNEIIINAMPFAPQSMTAAAQKIASEGGGIVKVAQALGKYAGDYLGNMVKQSAIAENYAQINKINQEIKATQTQLPNNSIPGTSSYLYTTLANSAVNKESLDATERQSVAKNLSVIDQLGSLQANIAKQNSTGFIKGNVNNLMAAIGQNADVGTINAQLQAIVPNLARGVYGEVGVLTDDDIANYRKTLPNLTSPKDQNDAVLALTLKAVQNNLKNTLVTAANSKKDVSRFIPQYNEVTQKINAINDKIGVNDVKVGEIVKANPQAKPMVEAMLKQGASGSQILQALGAD